MKIKIYHDKEHIRDFETYEDLIEWLNYSDEWLNIEVVK